MNIHSYLVEELPGEHWPNHITSWRRSPRRQLFNFLHEIQVNAFLNQVTADQFLYICINEGKRILNIRIHFCRGVLRDFNHNAARRLSSKLKSLRTSLLSDADARKQSDFFS